MEQLIEEQVLDIDNANEVLTETEGTDEEAPIETKATVAESADEEDESVKELVAEEEVEAIDNK